MDIEKVVFFVISLTIPLLELPESGKSTYSVHTYCLIIIFIYTSNPESLFILKIHFCPIVDALSCYKCSEKDNDSHCNDFYPSSQFAVPCGNKYDSCIQTYGSFNDFSGRFLLIIDLYQGQMKILPLM